MLHFSLETITPKAAKKLLESSESSDGVFINRARSESTVQKYAAMLKSDQWNHNTGETIKLLKVNGTGERVLDGQHRLAAVVQANKPQKFWVCRGISLDAFKYLDQGRPRTLADVMHIAGYPDPKVLSSAARMLWKEDVTDSPFEKPSAEDHLGDGSIFEYVDEKYNGKFREFYLFVKPELAKIQKRGLGGKGWLLYFFYRAHLVDAALSEKFVAFLSDPNGVSPHPALGFACEKVKELRMQHEKEGGGKVLKGRNKDLCDATISAYAVAWDCARKSRQVRTQGGFTARFNAEMEAKDFIGVK